MGKSYEAVTTESAAETILKGIAIKQKELDQIENELSDKVRALQEQYKIHLQPVQDAIEKLTKSLSAYAEASKNELLSGKKKSIKLKSGDIGWRKMPSKVVCSKPEDAIKTLEEKAPTFIRVTKSLNKEEILKNTESLPEGCGISIKQGNDVFWVKPKDTKTEHSENSK